MMAVVLVALPGFALLMRDEVAPLPANQSPNSERLVSSLHYGDNLICHERSGSLYLASGNNGIGQLQTKEFLRRSWIALEQHRQR